jgi:hypothetical protein
MCLISTYLVVSHFHVVGDMTVFFMIQSSEALNLVITSHNATKYANAIILMFINLTGWMDGWMHVRVHTHTACLMRS